MLDRLLLTSTFTASLFSHGNALPQAASNVPTAPLYPDRSPDKCGPVIQVAGDPADTCTAKPAVVPSAAAFGIVGMPPQRGSDLAGLIFDYAGGCSDAVTQICKTMADPATTAGRWYFSTGPLSTSTNNFNKACQVGFWMPNDGIKNTPGKSDPHAAQIPSTSQCLNIFNSMVAAAVANGEASDDDSGNLWMGNSINLLTSPKWQDGQSYYLPGGQGTGAAFNSGYPSYVLSQGPVGEQPLTPDQEAYQQGPFQCFSGLCCNAQNYCVLDLNARYP